MPVTRILYTLAEIKEILAKLNHCPVEVVNVYGGSVIEFSHPVPRQKSVYIDVQEDDYLFQVDIA